MKVAGLEVEELAALVCTTLDQHDINVVLTGGSCVSIWTHNAYTSLDLDFIALGLHSNREIGEALRTIGFTARKANGRYFEHPDTELVIEFPPGPLMVGDEQVREEHIDKRATEMGWCGYLARQIASRTGSPAITIGGMNRISTRQWRLRDATRWTGKTSKAGIVRKVLPIGSQHSKLYQRCLREFEFRYKSRPI
ncbi:hypothetical protein [Kineobactrum salinum]|uniref:hypothetical protein n=1 Tax=Kineobactrum salinum TaxID=2708301 RepID=UPI0018D6EB3F|nr:hypothetical protein [Kineobactrum salinum]